MANIIINVWMGNVEYATGFTAGRENAWHASVWVDGKGLRESAVRPVPVGDDSHVFRLGIDADATEGQAIAAAQELSLPAAGHRTIRVTGYPSGAERRSSPP